MSIVDEIKTRIDIVDLVANYVPLNKSGVNYRGLCPFHSEKTPSFFVFTDRQTWRCFGACASGGDVFSFIMAIETIDFSEALKKLADIAGIKIPDKRSQVANDYLYQINKAATSFYRDILLSESGNLAKKYLDNRGINSETINKFQLGLSPRDGHSLRQHLKDKGFSEHQVLLAGLLTQRDNGTYQDLFKNRLMFPIANLQGNTIGFGGRVLDNSNPKYLNSRQGPLFDKSRTIYALDLAQNKIKQDGIVVVEGYMDAIMAHQSGFINVVSCMGTSLTQHQANIIQKITQKVILALDPDSAGQEATLRSLETSWNVLQRNLAIQSKRNPLYVRPKLPDIKIASLPENKDPAQVILEDPAKWESLIQDAQPLMEFLFHAFSNKFDLSTAEGKSQMAETVFPLVTSIPNSFQQDHYFKKLAQILQVDEKTLEASIGRVQRNQSMQRRKNREVATITPFQQLGKDPLEEFCLALLIQNPELLKLSSHLRTEHFHRMDNREAFTSWLKGPTIGSQEEEIKSHIEYLGKKVLPPSSSKENTSALKQCITRLEERRLRWIKEEESLHMAGLEHKDLGEYEKQILNTNSAMEAIFKSKDS
ncbi:DNA primase [SAR202 cluster bacterium AC-409-J13_OGT_754m]|nr:DNA primase [SAR202 cluster bacterium AC-409-J13_OGT_754m]